MYFFWQCAQMVDWLQLNAVQTLSVIAPVDYCAGNKFQICCASPNQLYSLFNLIVSYCVVIRRLSLKVFVALNVSLGAAMRTRPLWYPVVWGPAVAPGMRSNQFIFKKKVCDLLQMQKKKKRLKKKILGSLALDDGRASFPSVMESHSRRFVVVFLSCLLNSIVIG